ncbi:MAG: tandem-95 repeat protein [Rhodospirillales bacterium]|nr:tandem-95 repeat protein [Rhodospirillales bacterium]
MGVDFTEQTPKENGTGDRYDPDSYPGYRYLLDGAGNSSDAGGRLVLQGFAHEINHVFIKGGGSDEFYGGATFNRTDYDTSDGFDTVRYGATPIKVTHVLYSQLLVEGTDGSFTDSLYSVERVNHKTFDPENQFIFDPFAPARYTLEDLTPAEIQQAQAELGDAIGSTITTSVRVNDPFGRDFILDNFNSFTGTDYADQYDLNVVLGRSFDGGAGSDWVFYRDVADARGVTIRLDDETAFINGTDQVAGPGGGPFDTLVSIENVYGSEFGDVIAGTDGDNNLFGWGGDDTFIGYAGADRIVGGDGFDTLDLREYTDGFNSYINAENVELFLYGAGDDVIFVPTNAVPIARIEAGDGQDTLAISAGDLEVTGDTVLFGNRITVNDVEHINLSNASVAAHVYINTLGHSYDGRGVFDYSAFGPGMTFNLATGIVSDGVMTDTHSGRNISMVATNYSDTIVTKSGANNWIAMGLGDDTVTAWTGNSTHNFLTYSGGNDYIRGGRGSVFRIDMDTGIDPADVSFTELNGQQVGQEWRFDLLITIAGRGTLTLENQYRTTDGSDLNSLPTITFDDGSFYDDAYNLHPDDPNDAFRPRQHIGGSGDDFLIAADILNSAVLDGRGGDDTIIGDDSVGSVYYGRSGNDTITGGNGAKSLYGGAGNDTISGGDGDDYIRGGSGDDFIRGGAGNDTYIFAPGDGFDTITETGGTDTLKIEGGLSFADLVFTQVGNDLQVDIASGVTIKDQFSGNPANVVEWVIFDNGAVMQLPNPFMQTNQPPMAADDVFSVAEDAALSGNVLADNGNGADSDPDGDALSVIAAEIITATGGSVILQADGSFIYAPALNYHGPDSFNYTVLDGNGGQDIGLVAITVDPVNDAPVAQDDVFATDEDTALAGNLLGDNGNGIDDDVDGDALSVVGGTFATAQGGTLFISPDGSFMYNPAADFNGLDTASYTLVDGQGGSDTAQLSIAVAPVNDSPEALNDAFTGTENQEIEGNLLADNGSGADFDIDGDSLQLVSDMTASAQGGSVIILGNGDFVYMPPANYFGPDSFEYTVTDGQGGSDVGTAFLTIQPSNEAPVAQDDVFDAYEGQTIAGNVLEDNGNGADFDPEGQNIMVQATVLVTAAGGIVSINEDGDFAYTPADGFYGSDSFEYTLVDDQGAQSIGMVTLEIEQADIVGTDGRDTLFGSRHDDIIVGLGGKDTLFGRNGDDALFGGEDKDALFGGKGDDALFGGAGKDRLYGNQGNDLLDGGDGDDYLNDSQGSNTLLGGAGNDRLYAYGRDNQTLDGGDGNDVLYTSRGDDTLEGGTGRDTLSSGSGDDMLSGGAGNDTLKGGSGDDLLIGGEGNDTLVGGQGNDTFKFTDLNGLDTIKDFEVGRSHGGWFDHGWGFGHDKGKGHGHGKHDGDTLDISDILQGEYDPVQDMISQFVEIERDGKDAILKVDADGDGTEFEMTAIAIINGGKHLDVQEMLENGSLVV